MALAEDQAIGAEHSALAGLALLLQCKASIPPDEKILLVIEVCPKVNEEYDVPGYCTHLRQGGMLEQEGTMEGAGRLLQRCDELHIFA